MSYSFAGVPLNRSADQSEIEYVVKAWGLPLSQEQLERTLAFMTGRTSGQRPEVLLVPWKKAELHWEPLYRSEEPMLGAWRDLIFTLGRVLRQERLTLGGARTRQAQIEWARLQLRRDIEHSSTAKIEAALELLEDRFAGFSALEKFKAYQAALAKTARSITEETWEEQYGPVPLEGETACYAVLGRAGHSNAGALEAYAIKNPPITYFNCQGHTSTVSCREEHGLFRIDRRTWRRWRPLEEEVAGAQNIYHLCAPSEALLLIDTFGPVENPSEFEETFATLLRDGMETHQAYQSARYL